MNRLRNEDEGMVSEIVPEMPRQNVVREEYARDRGPECETECEAPTPPTTTTNEIRGINIEPLNYGFIVKVGCQKFAFETYEKLISCLTDYMKDPAAIEKAWFAGEYLRKNK